MMFRFFKVQQLSVSFFEIKTHSPSHGQRSQFAALLPVEACKTKQCLLSRVTTLERCTNAGTEVSGFNLLRGPAHGERTGPRRPEMINTQKELLFLKKIMCSFFSPASTQTSNGRTNCLPRINSLFSATSSP